MNVVLPVSTTAAGPVWPLPAGSGTVNNVNVGQLRGTIWDGMSRYHALQLQASAPLNHGYQAQASYTWSSCIDDGSEASRGDQFQNGIISPLYFERAHRRGPCAFDLTHVLVANALWNIPGPASGVASAILGNWQLGGIMTASTG